MQMNDDLGDLFDPNTGLEKEADPDVAEIDKPFNPEKIKVTKTSPTIGLILDRIKHEEIDLAPDFQRRARIWPSHNKSRLIESLLLRIPLPAFYVAADREENWSVVDGLQRLTTILDFCNNEFSLIGMEYLNTLNGKNFEMLPRNMKRRIAETELNVNVIDKGTPEDVMFNIFKRLNTGGQSLNSQEIRNALHKGPVREFLADLAAEESFLRATDHGVKPDRMIDREFVLRFLSFYQSSWEEYEDEYLDDFLSSTMSKINLMSDEERDFLRNEFVKVMDVAHNIFGADAFRKRVDEKHSRKPLNKSLFEAWSVNIAKLSETDRALLVEKSESVKAKFRLLLNSDREFESSISASTSMKTRINKRFKSIQVLLEEVLDD